MSDTTFSI